MTFLERNWGMDSKIVREWPKVPRIPAGFRGKARHFPDGCGRKWGRFRRRQDKTGTKSGRYDIFGIYSALSPRDSGIVLKKFGGRFITGDVAHFAVQPQKGATSGKWGPGSGRYDIFGMKTGLRARKPRNVAGYDKIGTKAMTKSERGESPWKGLKNAGNSGLFRDRTEKVMTFLERSSGQNWNNGLRTVPVRTECQRGRYDKIGTERMAFRVPIFPGFVVLPCTFWNPGAKLWQKLE